MNFQTLTRTFLFLFTVLSTIAFQSAHAGGAGITYHGRLMHPNGHPVRSEVTFKIQIRTSGNENCLMYEELQVKDLSPTDGVFSLTLNDGSGTRTDELKLGFDKIFSNRARFDFPEGHCSMFDFYIPSAASSRRLVVSFNDGSFQNFESFPPQTINYVPVSVESMQVGGYKAENLLRVDGLPSTQPLNPTQYQNILDLADGSSNDYVKSSDIIKDNAVYDFARSPLPTCGAGKVLTSDNGSFICIDDKSLRFTGEGNVPPLPIAELNVLRELIDGTSTTYIKSTESVLNIIENFSNAEIPTCATGEVLTSANGETLSCIPYTLVDTRALRVAGTGNIEELTEVQYDNFKSLIDGISTLYVKPTDPSFSNIKAFARTDLPTCGAGQVLKSNGSSFSCVVGTNEISAQAPLAVIGNSLSLQLQPVSGLSVVAGQLGVAASGITNTMIASGVSGSKISGDISGKAANVTGVVALANGGTGASDAASARTNLGLGNSATRNIGSVSGSVAAGDDSRFEKPWRVVNTTATAIPGDRILVNSTSAPVTVNLPASPAAGTTVSFVDAAGTFHTNKLIVGRNGQMIMGLAENMDVDIRNLSFELVYVDASLGWRVR